MTPFFSSTFWALTVCDIHFCIWKMSKFVFMGSPLWSILVCKIPEFWRWKLWDQNFLLFDWGNTHIKETKNGVWTIAPEENCPPVRVRIWGRVRVRVGGNFNRGRLSQNRKKRRFTFSVQLKTKFVWSHGLLRKNIAIVLENYYDYNTRILIIIGVM